MLFEIVSVCKGGGYEYARTLPIHPKANAKGLYPLHRVLVENRLGRLLQSTEIPHHIDGNKFNNVDSNIDVLTKEEHDRLHSTERTLPLTKVNCGYCGTKFEVKHSDYMLRMRRSKTGLLFCSRSCGTKYNAAK